MLTSDSHGYYFNTDKRILRKGCRLYLIVDGYFEDQTKPQSSKIALSCKIHTFGLFIEDIKSEKPYKVV